MKTIIKLFFVLFIAASQANSSFAGNFLTTLISLKAEAQAQQAYFDGLIEEYREESKLGVIRTQNRVAIMDARPPQRLAREAQELQIFWAAFAQSVDSLLIEYEKISQNFSDDTYKFEPIQKAVTFLLIQISRAGDISFNDLVTRTSVITTNRFKGLKVGSQSFNATAEILTMLGDVNTAHRKDPLAHHHMNMNIDRLSALFYQEFRALPTYRSFFTDFKSQFAAYNYLSKFYVSSEPIPEQHTVVFPNDRQKWSDLIELKVLKVLPRVQDAGDQFSIIENIERNLNLSKPYPLEGNFILKPDEKNQTIAELVDMMRLNLISDMADLKVKLKKHLANKKKRAKKKKAALALRAEKEAEEEPELEEKTENSLEEKEAVQECATEPMKSKSDIDGTEYFDFISLRAQKKSIEAQHEANEQKSTKGHQTIKLKGNAAKIYSTAMGRGTFQTTNKDLAKFLSQVGGHFVKCSGANSDIKIALPNFKPGSTEPFWVDKMHLMHSGSEPFPISRLKIHLRRMIEISCLDQVIE